MTNNRRNPTQPTSSGKKSGLLTRRRFLATSGVIAVSGCLGGKTTESPNTEVDGTVASVPIPNDPSSSTYAMAGSADRPTVTYYGNWKCPYCADFSTGLLGDIITDYVKPRDISLRFRALAFIDGKPFLGSDAPRAARAGLAVWDIEPETYWPYHEYVFANQPPESETWATTDKLVSFAEEAGMTETGQLRTKIQGQAYESPTRETSQPAANAGVLGTPALVIDGETVNPLGDEQQTRTLIEQLADGS